MPDDLIVEQKEWMCLRKGRDVYVDCADGVMCVPLLPNGEVIFIIEPDAMSGASVLYLPAGGIEEGEAPEETANRELQEEIGMKANRITPLGQIKPWSKYLSASLHLYIMRDLEPSKLDGDEVILGEKRLPLMDFEQHIASGDLMDASVISALFMARSMLMREVKGL